MLFITHGILSFDVFFKFVPKKRYQAVGFPYNRMMKLSNSRGIRIDVTVLCVSRSVVDHPVILQALKKTYRARGPSYWRSPLLEVLLSRSSCTGYNFYLFVVTLLEEFGGGIGPLL